MTVLPGLAAPVAAGPAGEVPPADADGQPADGQFADVLADQVVVRSTATDPRPAARDAAGGAPTTATGSGRAPHPEGAGDTPPDAEARGDQGDTLATLQLQGLLLPPLPLPLPPLPVPPGVGVPDGVPVGGGSVVAVMRRTVTEFAGMAIREDSPRPVSWWVCGATVSGANGVLRAEGSPVSTMAVPVPSIFVTPWKLNLADCICGDGLTIFT
jgi:hypothetical protein